MTEPPVDPSSGSCHKARGCPGPTSPKLDGAADPKPHGPAPPGPAPPGAKQNGLACNVRKTSGPVSTGPAATRPAPKGLECTDPGICPGPNEEGKFVVCRRKCGCAKTSDKVKEILQTFPHPPPPDALQTYMAKKNDKASGFSYGQPERHGCRSCNKPKETELSASAGSAITSEKDKTDSCTRCILHRRKLREAADEDEKQTVKEKHYCSTCNKPKDLKEVPVERSASASLPVKKKIMNVKEKQHGIKPKDLEVPVERSASAGGKDGSPSVLVKDNITNVKEKQHGIKPKDPEVPVERSAPSGGKDGYPSVLVKDNIMNVKEKFHCTNCTKPKEVPVERGASAGGKGCCLSGPANDIIMSCGRKSSSSRSWQIVSELVSLVQLSVTATALALYYLIYCYMQLVYYTLRSALYFHNADGPMKITIGVVTLTSLIVGFNILMRMEGIIGIVY